MNTGIELPEDIAALLTLHGGLIFTGWQSDNNPDLYYMDVRRRAEEGYRPPIVRNACGVLGLDNAMDVLRTWIIAGCPEHIAITIDENFVLTAYPGSTIRNGDIHIVRNSYNGAPDASD